jgi:hypothetical protein
MRLPKVPHVILILLTRKNVTESWKLRILDSSWSQKYERDTVTSVWEDFLMTFLPEEILRKVDPVATVQKSRINCGLGYRGRGTCFLTPCLVLAHSIVVATQAKKTFQNGEDFYHFVEQLNSSPSNIPVHLLITDWARMLSNPRKRHRDDDVMKFYEEWSKGNV